MICCSAERVSSDHPRNCSYDEELLPEDRIPDKTAATLFASNLCQKGWDARRSGCQSTSCFSDAMHKMRIAPVQRKKQRGSQVERSSPATSSSLVWARGSCIAGPMCLNLGKLQRNLELPAIWAKAEQSGV